MIIKKLVKEYFNESEVNFDEIIKGKDIWVQLGLLSGINNELKENEVVKWFARATDFIENAEVEYDKEFETAVLPMIRRIICSPNGAIDDFSIENLYKEFAKDLPVDVKLIIDKTEDPEAEKIIYICNKFVKKK